MGTPLQSSGPISLRDLRFEFTSRGGNIATAPDTIMEYYLGSIQPVSGGSVPSSGAISLSDFYGLEQVYVVNLTIGSNTQSYNIKNAAIAAGWNGVDAVEVNLTINAGVVVYGSHAGRATYDGLNEHNGGSGGVAMDTGDFNGLLHGDINIDMSGTGKIVGGGGGGGSGCESRRNNTDRGGNGGNGGTGLVIRSSDTVNITNGGDLAGGGGGGGGAPAYGVSYVTGNTCGKLGSDPCVYAVTMDGCGGGGGASYALGGGGGYGDTVSGYTGYDGSSTSGGAARRNSDTDPNGNVNYGNYSGAGGDWGANGATAQDKVNYSGDDIPGSGGSRGLYVSGSANLTLSGTTVTHGAAA